MWAFNAYEKFIINFFVVILFHLGMLFACFLRQYSFLQVFFLCFFNLYLLFNFFLSRIYPKKKRAEIVLQHALSKSTGTNIFLSVTQAMELEPFMNHFTKINKHIQNSTNNLEGLSQYRLSEEMQRRRDQSLTQ
jgi:hypothetical protein